MTFQSDSAHHKNCHPSQWRKKFNWPLFTAKEDILSSTALFLGPTFMQLPGSLKMAKRLDHVENEWQKKFPFQASILGLEI